MERSSCSIVCVTNIYGMFKVLVPIKMHARLTMGYNDDASRKCNVLLSVSAIMLVMSRASLPLVVHFRSLSLSTSLYIQIYV